MKTKRDSICKLATLFCIWATTGLAQAGAIDCSDSGCAKSKACR